jgi:DNA-binding beta-propeller fold protein YncE
MAWVGDDVSGTGQVVQLLPSGSVGSRVLNVSRPIGIAVDPVDQSLWICERDVNQVMHLDAGMNLIAITPVIAPTRVAVDSATHEAWVTSYTRSKVLRLAANGARLDSVAGILGPVGVAIDARRGRIWVADFDQGQVVALRRSGAVEVAIARLGGPSFLAVDLASGEVWATLQTARLVVRLSPSGTGSVLRQVSGFTVPYGIGLYAGP